MRWAVTIGRVFGITVRLHVTFLLLLGFIGYGGYVDAGLGGATWALLWACSIFACIIFHELGHSVVAQQLGVDVNSITLLPIGGVAALKRIPENPWHELAITLAGPMVNAAIAVVLLPFTGLPTHYFLVSLPHNLPGLLQALVAANIALFLFNFIPAFPMDGGRLLRAVLALLTTYRRATVIATTVGQGLAILFILAGLKWSLMLILIGAFIFIAAEGEEKIVKMRSLLRDLDVAEVMTRDFVTLTPQDTIARGLTCVYQTGQDDFPVVEDGQLLGVATRQAMVDAVNTRGAEVSVGEILDANVPIVSAQDKVTRVYDDFISEHGVSVPVMNDGELVGMLAPENISRYLLVQASLKSSRRRQPARPAAPERIAALPPVIASAPPVVIPPPRAEASPPSGPA